MKYVWFSWQVRNIKNLSYKFHSWYLFLFGFSCWEMVQFWPPCKNIFAQSLPQFTREQARFKASLQDYNSATLNCDAVIVWPLKSTFSQSSHSLLYLRASLILTVFCFILSRAVVSFFTIHCFILLAPLWSMDLHCVWGVLTISRDVCILNEMDREQEEGEFGNWRK